jgi:uncharacterized protein YjbI with pentapeptide repeats
MMLKHFPNIILGNADLIGADLPNADLSGADLYDADLSGASLPTPTNLQLLDQSGAKLPTILHNADLTGADLGNADLTGAGLNGANLTNTDLNFADLTNTDLNLANLNEAVFDCNSLRTDNLTAEDVSRIHIVDSDLNPVSSCE